MSKGKYDPRRVAQLERELFGTPIPPSLRGTWLRSEEQALDNEVEMEYMLNEYDLDGEED